jgi:hypothetical protein
MTSGNVTVRWTSKGHIGSHIAGILAQSRNFNHVMLIDDGMAHEAVMFRAVHCCRPEIAMRGVRRYQDMKVFVSDLEAMREFMRDQYGKPYDYGGAFGLPIQQAENWQSDDKWWCSEFVLAALVKGGAPILDPAQVHRITPDALGQVNLPKSEIFHPSLAVKP